MRLFLSPNHHQAIVFPPDNPESASFVLISAALVSKASTAFVVSFSVFLISSGRYNSEDIRFFYL